MASFNYNLVVLEVEVIFHAISKIIKLSLLSIRIILLFRGGAQLVCDSQCKMLVSFFFWGRASFYRIVCTITKQEKRLTGKL